MSRFTPETIERVRDASDIVEIVSAYTDLRRQGERFVGLCPFHDERTPSFSVKPRDGFYYCFGCEAGGDTIRFVQEKEGLAFPDAVEALAERYGVEIERDAEDPQAEEARRRRGRLGEALERVAAFYESYLWESPKAAKARAYLIEERGLGEEVLRNFGVGFAPSAWDSVLTRGPARRLLGRRAARRRPDPALPEQARQPLRPLPRPDRLSGPRPSRPGGRVRRPRHGRRRAGRST